MFRKSISLIVTVSFLFSLLTPVSSAHADTILNLPAPGTMVNLSPAYQPALIKGLTVHKDNPFLFDFIVDTGNSGISGNELKKEGDRLVKYFFACLTIPEKDLWVNLSPYEKDRMVPQALGQTALGRDLLAQDYILKQLTASLIYPEKHLGKDFWDRVYAKAQQMYGTTQIPVNTFNKVWIVADKANVFEHGQTAFVVSGHLKVMLEEDYLALSRHSGRSVILSEAKDLNKLKDSSATSQNDSHFIASQIVRQIILPEIEKEVNTGKNFSTLRQIFNSLILASWYKKNLKQALLNQVYSNKSTVKGIERSGIIPAKAGIQNQDLSPEKIYEQYLKAYKKGVFNYIKEDLQPDGQAIPRKYFSGGFVSNLTMTVDNNVADAAQVSRPIGNMLDFAVGVNPVTAPDAAMKVNVVFENSKAKNKTFAPQAIVDTIGLILQLIDQNHPETVYLNEGGELIYSKSESSINESLSFEVFRDISFGLSGEIPSQLARRWELNISEMGNRDEGRSVRYGIKETGLLAFKDFLVKQKNKYEGINEILAWDELEKDAFKCEITNKALKSISGSIPQNVRFINETESRLSLLNSLYKKHLNKRSELENARKQLYGVLIPDTIRSIDRRILDLRGTLSRGGNKKSILWALEILWSYKAVLSSDAAMMGNQVNFNLWKIDGKTLLSVLLNGTNHGYVRKIKNKSFSISTSNYVTTISKDKYLPFATREGLRSVNEAVSTMSYAARKEFIDEAVPETIKYLRKLQIAYRLLDAQLLKDELGGTMPAKSDVLILWRRTTIRQRFSGNDSVGIEKWTAQTIINFIAKKERYETAQAVDKKNIFLFEGFGIKFSEDQDKQEISRKIHLLITGEINKIDHDIKSAEEAKKNYDEYWKEADKEKTRPDAAMNAEEDGPQPVLTSKAIEFIRSFDGLEGKSPISTLIKEIALSWEREDKRLTWQDLESVLATRNKQYGIARQGAVIFLSSTTPAIQILIKSNLVSVWDTLVQHTLPSFEIDNFVRKLSYLTLASIDSEKATPVLIQGISLGSEHSNMIRSGIIEYVRDNSNDFKDNQKIRYALKRIIYDSNKSEVDAIRQEAKLAKKYLDSAKSKNRFGIRRHLVVVAGKDELSDYLTKKLMENGFKILRARTADAAFTLYTENRKDIAFNILTDQTTRNSVSSKILSFEVDHLPLVPSFLLLEPRKISLYWNNQFLKEWVMVFSRWHYPSDYAMSGNVDQNVTDNGPFFATMRAIKISEENKPNAAMLALPPEDLILTAVGIVGVSEVLWQYWLRPYFQSKDSGYEAIAEARKKIAIKNKHIVLVAFPNSPAIIKEFPVADVREVLQALTAVKSYKSSGKLTKVKFAQSILRGLSSKIPQRLEIMLEATSKGGWSFEGDQNAFHEWLQEMEEWLQEIEHKSLSNPAMTAVPDVNGGIDLNTSNGMQWKVSKDGSGVEMNVDPAMIERVRREGIDSLSPVIFKITPITSIWPLVGLQAPAQEENATPV